MKITDRMRTAQIELQKDEGDLAEVVKRLFAFQCVFFSSEAELRTLASMQFSPFQQPAPFFDITPTPVTPASFNNNSSNIQQPATFNNHFSNKFLRLAPSAMAFKSMCLNVGSLGETRIQDSNSYSSANIAKVCNSTALEMKMLEMQTVSSRLQPSLLQPFVAQSEQSSSCQ
ncbi:hypothetical protein FCV25MIE_04887 [Fagus crenata]